MLILTKTDFIETRTIQIKTMTKFKNRMKIIINGFKFGSGDIKTGKSNIFQLIECFSTK